MPPANYDLSPFGREHFGGARLGDARRDKSLIDLGNRLSRHPQGTLPDKLKDPNALRRCYDLMNTETVTHPSVLCPHVRATAGQLLDYRGVALCLHDLTELDYTTLSSLLEQLGQIGDGRGRCQGTSTFSHLGDTNCYAGSRLLQTVWSPERAFLPPSSSGLPSLRPHLVPATLGPGSLAAHPGCGILACRAKRRRALLASNPTKG